MEWLACSPDLNPIRLPWTPLKALFRQEFKHSFGEGPTRSEVAMKQYPECLMHNLFQKLGECTRLASQ